MAAENQADIPLVDTGLKLSEGKLKPFTAMMSRDDVPIFIRPGDGSIEISATKRQHGVFSAFFQMIDPSGDRADAGFPTMLYSGDSVPFFTGVGGRKMSPFSTRSS